MSEGKTIYDIGMHNGDDTEYYLLKGFKVVSVEANSLLCRAAEQRFASHIASGRLKILNVAVADRPGRMKFYVNKKSSVLSSLQKPADMNDWEEVECDAVPIIDILRSPDTIEFVKIDIEGYDAKILGDMQRHGILPSNVSAEAHKVDVICKLVSMGYTKFKIVNCLHIGRKTEPTNIKAIDGSVKTHRFPAHSSGPFGDDLPGQWLSADQVLYSWLGRNILSGPGWYDVHATGLQLL